MVGEPHPWGRISNEAGPEELEARGTSENQNTERKRADGTADESSVLAPQSMISRSPRVTEGHANEMGTWIVDRAVHLHQDLART